MIQSEIPLMNPTTEFTNTQIDSAYLQADALPETLTDMANASQAMFLGVPLWEPSSVLNLTVRFLFNLLITFIIVGLIYYRKNGSRGFALSFMLFSVVMYLLIQLMENLELQIGFTLGLFAIFGMIRYRTETLPVREMTYLFVIIGVAVINGLSMAVSWAELLLANAFIICIALALEAWSEREKTTTKIILYEKIDNIKPEKRDELIQDLKDRTGIDIIDVEIGHVDFLRDVAYIKIKYMLHKGEENTIGNITKFKTN